MQGAFSAKSLYCLEIWTAILLLCFHRAAVSGAPLLFVPGKISEVNADLAVWDAPTQSIFFRAVPNDCSIDCVEESAKDRIIVSEAISVQGSFARHSLPLPESFPEGTYTFQVCDAGGASESLECTDQTLIANRTDVLVTGREAVVVIELDKPIYKPDQTAQIRALCLRKDLKPCEDVEFEISVTNPDGFKILRKKGGGGKYGVFTTELDIIDGSPLGDYKVAAVASVEDVRMESGVARFQASETLSVEEYVLPKFDVTVSVDQGFLNANSEGTTSITGQVSAKYTYGKPVQGDYIVTLKCERRYHYYRGLGKPVGDANRNDEVIQDAVVDAGAAGKGTFNIPLDAEDFSSCNEVLVLAEVEEDATGIRQETQESIPISSGSLTVELEHSGVYSPGLPYVIDLKATDELGAPVEANLMVQIESHKNSYYNDGKEEWVEVPKLKVSQNVMTTTEGTGTARLIIPPASQECKDFLAAPGERYFYQSACHDTVTVNVYKKDGGDSNATGSFITSACVAPQYSQGGSFITLHVPKGQRSINVGANDSLSLTVEATDDPGEDSAIYMVVSGGDIFEDGLIGAFSKEEDASWFTSTTTVSFGQVIGESADVVVLVPEENGFLTVKTTVNVTGKRLNNTCTVTPSKTEVNPGEDLQIQVSSSPHSRAFLLAIDESVSILDERETQMTKERIFQALASKNGQETATYESAEEPCPAWSVLKSAGINVGGSLECGMDSFPRCCSYSHIESDIAFAVADGAPLAMTKTSQAAPQAPPSTQPESNPQSAKIRTIFPESWRLQDDRNPDVPPGQVDLGNQTEVLINVNAPDTITTYKFYSFAISQDSGLGVSENSASLTIFRDVFAQLSLPYSIKLGEEVTVTGSVFNYMDEEIEDAEFVLSGDGVLFGLGNDPFESRKEIGRRVQPLDAESIKFQLKGASAGAAEVTLAVYSTSVCDGLCDGVQRTVIVKPSGSRQDYSKTAMITSSSQTTFPMPDFETLTPVDGSIRAQFSVIGDIMGPTIQNLGRLVRMPSGCGEQNMIGFSPNVFVLMYVNAAGADLPKIKAQAARFVEIGYQRELKYMHSDDASFSAFGEQDKEGSSWLTAFVLKCFLQAHYNTDFKADQDILERSRDYLIAQQIREGPEEIVGSFETRGQVFHESMLGGVSGASDADKVTAMTAYKTITLLEYRTNQLRVDNVTEERLDKAVTRAISYLKQQAIDKPQSVSTYTYIIAAYAIAMAETKEVPADHRMDTGVDLEAVIKVLDEKSSKGELGGATVQFWENDQVGNECGGENAGGMYWCFQPPTAEVEMTAYALLTKLALVKAKWETPTIENEEVSAALGDATGIVRWLVEKRNELGGYSSTQDTVVALQALSAYASFFPRDEDSEFKNAGMNVSINYGQKTFEFEAINADTADLLQIHPLEEESLEMDTLAMTAEGTGLVIATLHVSWYISPEVVELEGPEKPPFVVQSGLYFEPTAADDRRKLLNSEGNSTESECVFAEYNITSHEASDASCGMMVAELERPSGYEMAAEGCAQVCDSVQSIEHKPDMTAVYFTCIKPGTTCRVACKLCETYPVKNREKLEARVYRYYKPDVEARTLTAFSVDEVPDDRFDDFGKGGLGGDGETGKNGVDSGSFGRTLAMAACAVVTLLLTLIG